MKPRLIRIDTGEVFPLGDAETVIGRSPGCTVVVEDPSVSNQHASIARTSEGTFVVRDSGSTNGTYINDNRITQTSLTEGQILKIGSIAFGFRTTDAVPPCPPIEERVPTPSSSVKPKPSIARKVLVVSGIGCGALLLLLIVVIVIGSSISQSTAPGAANGSRVEELLRAEYQEGFTQNKQKLFDRVHPIGTAKSVTVHDVTVISWKHGQDTNRFEDILQLKVRFTLYWEGPLTTDGFTKLSLTYDRESRRYIAPEVLATNGITNKDVGEGVGTLFENWLQYEAQKEGAENAAREYLNR